MLATVFGDRRGGRGVRVGGGALVYLRRAQETHRCRGLPGRAITHKLAAVGDGGVRLRQGSRWPRGKEKEVRGE